MQNEHQTSWENDGYVVLRQLYTPERVTQLHSTCERILHQWREECPQTGKPGGGENATSMRHLNHPAYFQEDPEGLRDMLCAIADPKILSLCRTLFGADPLFRCTSLFMNPVGLNVDGDWHRDTQFLYPDETEEQAKIAQARGVGNHIQLQIALVPSDDIEYVPGSHLRWDTPEEYAIRRAEGGAKNREAMPNAVRIALEPGDAVGFNAYGLHRGRYHAHRLRRTWMLTFTDSRTPLYDYFSHQPWFLEAGYLDGLEGEARHFFEAFVAEYAKHWQP